MDILNPTSGIPDADAYGCSKVVAVRAGAPSRFSQTVHLRGENGRLYDRYGWEVYGSNRRPPAHLYELEDVDVIVRAPADGDSLTYDIATDKWIPRAITTGGGGGGGGGVATRYLPFSHATIEVSTFATPAVHLTNSNGYVFLNCITDVITLSGFQMVSGSMPDTSTNLFRIVGIPPEVPVGQRRIRITLRIGNVAAQYGNRSGSTVLNVRLDRGAGSEMSGNSLFIAGSGLQAGSLNASISVPYDVAVGDGFRVGFECHDATALGGVDLFFDYVQIDVDSVFAYAP